MKFLDHHYIKQSGVLNYVEHRLELWANWYSQNDYPHLGYPKESLESRHLNNGGVIHSHRGPKPLACNPAAEELEAIMIILRQADDRIAAALCQEYLDKRGQGVKAKMLGLSLAQFKIDVGQGRQWLHGWFYAHLIEQLNALTKK